MSTGLNADAADLLAACVEANVRSLAHTTDSIIAITERQRDDLARAYVRLYNAVAAAPDSIRTVAQEAALWDGAGTYESALHFLDKEDSS